MAHASHVGRRWVALPTPRPCFIAPSVTILLYSTTVSQALRQPLRAGVPEEYPPAPATTRPQGHGGGTEDVEVGDTRLLTNFSTDGEYTFNTL
jgi:hypothetical protein